MVATLVQHYTWDAPSSIPALAALSLLLTLLAGALRLRALRKSSQQPAQEKPLFPQSRVFLVEKSVGPGCARPCATGPLFQFDTSDTHESLDFAESYRALDQEPGSDPVTLFVPNYERPYEQQSAPFQDMYAPLPAPSLQAWKQQPQHRESGAHYQRPRPQYAGLDSLDYYSPQQQGNHHRLEPRFFEERSGNEVPLGYAGAVEFGEDDSDSGASLPSQNIESLDLMDSGPLMPGPHSLGDVTSLQQPANPFASMPPVADDAISRDANGPPMPFDRVLEPLDPTFALDMPPHNRMSENLHGTSVSDHEPREADFLLDPNNLLCSSSMPLPLSNSSYRARNSYVGTVGLDDSHYESNDSTDEGLGFSHLSARDADSFYFRQPNHVGRDRLMDIPSNDLLLVQPTLNHRHKASLSKSPPLKKSADIPRRPAPVHIRESIKLELALAPGTHHKVDGEAHAVKAPVGHASDGEAPSLTGSGGNSPRSPKETDGSSDDTGARYRCPHCDTTFRIRGYLTRHIKKHADVMMYNCPFFNPDDEHRCHATGGFSRRDTYKTHLKARHFLYPRGTGRKERAHMPGNCSGCGERFNNNEEWIETHIQTGLCTGQAINSEQTATRDGSLGSSPSSERGAGVHLDNYVMDNNGPYQHDFQRQNMLMTHVQ